MGLEDSVESQSASLSFFVDHQNEPHNMIFRGSKERILNVLRKFPLSDIMLYYIPSKDTDLMLKVSYSRNVKGHRGQRFQRVFLRPNLDIKVIDYAGHIVAEADVKRPASPFASFDVIVDNSGTYSLSVFFPKGM